MGAIGTVEKEGTGPWELCEGKGLEAPIGGGEPLVFKESNSLWALQRLQEYVCVLWCEGDGISQVKNPVCSAPCSSAPNSTF